MSLEGRVALVTGSGFGMGRAHCLELSRQGAFVGVNDIEAEAAERTVAEVHARGGRALALPGDVASREDVEALVGKLAGEAGGIDVLVSNAGTIHSSKTLVETDDVEWHRSFAVHVGGALNTSRACLPYLEQSSAGRIIFISSMWGQAGFHDSHAYCAAKGALIAFSKSLAKELGPKGICVNNVAPGGVHTRMTEPPHVSKEELEDECEREIPLGRYADPDEIARVVAFLASTASSFVTGQTIGVNGGQLIGGF